VLSRCLCIWAALVNRGSSSTSATAAPHSPSASGETTRATQAAEREPRRPADPGPKARAPWERRSARPSSFFWRDVEKLGPVAQRGMVPATAPHLLPFVVPPSAEGRQVHRLDLPPEMFARCTRGAVRPALLMHRERGSRSLLRRHLVLERDTEIRDERVVHFAAGERHVPRHPPPALRPGRRLMGRFSRKVGELLGLVRGLGRRVRLSSDDETRGRPGNARRRHWSACGPSPVDASEPRTRSHHLRNQRCLVSAGTASPANCGCVGGIATHSCGGGPLPSHSAHAPSTTVKRGVMVTSSRPGCAAQMCLMWTSTDGGTPQERCRMAARGDARLGGLCDCSCRFRRYRRGVRRNERDMSVPNFVERRGLGRLPSVPGFVVRFPARAVRPLTVVDRCRAVDASVLGANKRDAVGLRRLHYHPPQASEQANCIRDCLHVSATRNWLLALSDTAGRTGRATGTSASRATMPFAGD
jgi:hypothetical protein